MILESDFPIRLQHLTIGKIGHFDIVERIKTPDVQTSNHFTIHGFCTKVEPIKCHVKDVDIDDWLVTVKTNHEEADILASAIQAVTYLI